MKSHPAGWLFFVIWKMGRQSLHDRGREIKEVKELMELREATSPLSPYSLTSPKFSKLINRNRD